MNKNQKSFGIIEIIIATTIIGIVALGTIQLGVMSLQMTQRSSDQIEAGFLLQEASEAVKFIRDTGWNSNISTLNFNNNYYIQWNGSNYIITTNPQSLISNKFQRIINFSSVRRNLQDNISDSGTLDPNTVKVKINVIWDDRGIQNQREVEFYITNLLSN